MPISEDLFQPTGLESAVGQERSQRTMKAGLSSLGVAGLALVAVLWIVNLSLAAESNIPMPSPQAVYDHGVGDAEPKGKGTGENFCWHAASLMSTFVEGYEASHDPAWLDAGVKYYDWCVGKMAVGPDGYKGRSEERRVAE